MAETHIGKKVFWLLILSLCWAANATFVKLGDYTFGPITLMMYRGILSFLFMIIVLKFKRLAWLHYFKNWRLQSVWMLSSALIAYMWFTFAACEEVLTAGMAALLISGLVLFSWLIALFLTKEKRFNFINFSGIVVGIIGLIIMLGWSSIFNGNASFWAAMLYLSGLLTFALAAALNKHKSKNINPFISLTFSMFYVSVFLIIAAFMWEKPLAYHLDLNGIIGALGSSIVGTGIGYMLFFWLVHYAGQVFASSNSYIIPIFGVLLGVIFLHEPLVLHQIIGGIIVIIGAFLTNKIVKAKVI